MIIASINKPSFGDSIWLDFSKKKEKQIENYISEDIIAITNSSGDCLGLNLNNWSKKLEINKDKGFINLNSKQVSLICSELPNFQDKILEEFDTPYFFVGEVEAIDQHPKLQKLKLIKVNIGNKVLDLISGSVNLKLGLKTVLARTGSILPDGKIVLRTKMGGVISNGMLCNRKDLKLDHPEIKGAIEIKDSNIKIGSDFYNIDKINY